MWKIFLTILMANSIALSAKAETNSLSNEINSTNRNMLEARKLLLKNTALFAVRFVVEQDLYSVNESLSNGAELWCVAHKNKPMHYTKVRNTVIESLNSFNKTGSSLTPDQIEEVKVDLDILFDVCAEGDNATDIVMADFGIYNSTLKRVRANLVKYSRTAVAN